MKRLLSILLLFVSFGALAQTYDTLPTGSKPYGAQPYLLNNGNILMGTSALKYRVVPTKARVDSLLELKQDVLTFQNGLTKTGNTVKLGGNGSWATTNAAIDLFSTFGAQIAYTNPTTTNTSSLVVGKDFADNSNFVSLGVGQLGGGISLSVNTLNGVSIFDQKYNRGLRGEQLFAISDKKDYTQKGYVDSLLALKAPASGSADYLHNNNTGTAQSASFNINGTGRFDSPTSTTLFNPGIGSFATETGVTTINGGNLNAQQSNGAIVSVTNTDDGSQSKLETHRLNIGGVLDLNTFGLTQYGRLTYPNGGSFEIQNSSGGLIFSANEIKRTSDNKRVLFDGDALPITGGTISGNLTLNGTVNASNFAVNSSQYYFKGSDAYLPQTTIQDALVVRGFLKLTTDDAQITQKLKLNPGAPQNPLESEITLPSESGTLALLSDINSTISDYQTKSEKAQPNGYASLDGTGKIPIIQMPDALVGAVVYQGNYDASTNTPALPAATGNKGKYYVVSVGGTQQSLTFENGDWIISNGAIWQKVDNSTKVTSVNGMTGAVNVTDITGNAGSATNWGSSQADFTSPATGTISWIAGFEAETSKTRPWDASKIKAFLGVNENNSSSTIVQRSSGGDINSNNFLTGTSKMGTWAGGSSFARFGHKDYDIGSGSSAYAFLQNNDGTVFVKGTNLVMGSVTGGYTLLDGNVGVNVIPTEALDVNGNIKGNGTLTVGTATPSAALFHARNSVAGMIIGESGTSSNYYDADSHQYRSADGNVEYMAIKNSNLLVGSNVDDGINKLQVSGNAKITGDITSSIGDLKLLRTDNEYAYILRSNAVGKRKLKFATEVDANPLDEIYFRTNAALFSNLAGTGDRVVLADPTGGLKTTTVVPNSTKWNGQTLGITGLATGDFVKYNGTNWINSKLYQTDFSNPTGTLTRLAGFNDSNEAQHWSAAQVRSFLSTEIATSGTYTPTLTGIFNNASTSALTAHYTRVGNEVTVIGRISAASTAAGTMQIGISLPISSALTNTEDASGFGTSTATSPNRNVDIYYRTASSTVVIETVTNGTGSENYRFQFTYTIK